MQNDAPRPPSGTQWTIAAAGHEAVVVEVGGGLRTYRNGGVDLLDGYGPDEVCPGGAGQVLAPWPNRIRDGQYAFGGRSLQLTLTEPTRNNAMHGLVNWVPWHLVERADDAVTVGYDLPPQPGYPWALRLRARYAVGQDGLRVEFAATNVGGEPCPFGYSAHPYLRLPGAVDDLALRVPGRLRVQVDGRMLPVGATPVAGTEYDYTKSRRIGDAVLDTAFGDVTRDADGGSSVTLAAPGDAASVHVWADREFGWWQVFTGDTLSGERHRRSVAVEPMTCPPDAFRSGKDVITLEPGDTWRGTWGIRPGA
ncbi:aldose 1-epimerase family protein [Micromonospora okii]|uniref:aldose 1-epimerase family protein n=1 Tax=Micromonospora okii TaxID=1182970 RepID=UPI001E4262C3|nr:aldose 1-epimerase family protein [Micromonospora okii]